MDDLLRTKRIELCDDAGNVQLTLSAGKHLGGLWIRNKTGHTIAIWTETDRAAIGLYAPGNQQACDASVSIEGDGKVNLQLRRADGTFSVKELTAPVGISDELPELASVL